MAINFVKNDDIKILRDIEQYYSTTVDEVRCWVGVGVPCAVCSAALGQLLGAGGGGPRRIEASCAPLAPSRPAPRPSALLLQMPVSIQDMI